MKTSTLLTTILVLFTLTIFGSSNKNSVRIKILHQKHVVLDTVIYEQGQQAIKAIEKIVSLYTNETIYIDASQVRELYVFSFELIKDQSKPSKVEPLVVNIDSIMNSIVTRIEKAINDSVVKAVRDSINRSVQEMKQAIRAIDKSDVQKAKDDFSEFIDKVKETRVIIIQEGDTIKIPNK